MIYSKSAKNQQNNNIEKFGQTEMRIGNKLKVQGV